MNEKLNDTDMTRSESKQGKNKQDTLDNVKMVTEVIVSIGVGAIVGNIIKSTTPVDVRLYKKICIVIGGQVLSRMTAEAATDYSDRKIDEGFGKLDEAIEKVQSVSSLND